MTRQILIVVGVALLSALGFALVLGIGYLTLHLVLGDSLYTLESHLHAMLGVLTALFALIAFVAAGWTTSVLAARRKREDAAHAVRR
jgi:hypothetical protein